MRKVLIVCDVDEGLEHEDTVATTSHEFTIDGEKLSVDLCHPHDIQFEAFLALQQQWKERARPVEAPVDTPRRVRARPPRDQDAGRVREWARENGIELGDRGRIPEDVRAKYLAAQQAETPSQNGSVSLVR